MSFWSRVCKIIHSPGLVVKLCSREIREMSSSLSSSAINRDRLVWVDLEMTGLDVDKHRIIEMACIITDGDLRIIEEGPDLVIHQPDDVLQAMGEWCVRQHAESGLTEAVKQSTLSLADAEEQMLQFVRRLTPKGVCPLAGNSVHCDKMFLDKYMRKFMAHLHYRIVDVSTIKELSKRWYPRVDEPVKKRSHRALDDIKESIEELKYYRETIFKRMP